MTDTRTKSVAFARVVMLLTFRQQRTATVRVSACPCYNEKDGSVPVPITHGAKDTSRCKVSPHITLFVIICFTPELQLELLCPGLYLSALWADEARGDDEA